MGRLYRKAKRAGKAGKVKVSYRKAKRAGKAGKVKKGRKR